MDLENLGSGWYSHLNASLLVGFNTKDSTVFGGAVVGYRPFNWTVSIGPAVWVDGAGFKGGAAAVIELTR